MGRRRLTRRTSRTRKFDCCGIMPHPERGLRRFNILLITKTPTLHPSFLDELKQWTPFRPLDDGPSRYEAEKAIRSLETERR